MLLSPWRRGICSCDDARRMYHSSQAAALRYKYVFVGERKSLLALHYYFAVELVRSIVCWTGYIQRASLLTVPAAVALAKVTELVFKLSAFWNQLRVRKARQYLLR